MAQKHKFGKKKFSKNMIFRKKSEILGLLGFCWDSAGIYVPAAGILQVSQQNPSISIPARTGPLTVSWLKFDDFWVFFAWFRSKNQIFCPKNTPSPLNFGKNHSFHPFTPKHIWWKCGGDKNTPKHPVTPISGISNPRLSPVNCFDVHLSHFGVWP